MMMTVQLVQRPGGGGGYKKNAIATNFDGYRRGNLIRNRRRRVGFRGGYARHQPCYDDDYDDRHHHHHHRDDQDDGSSNIISCKVGLR